MNARDIYMDNSATTMLDPAVVKTMDETLLLVYGNASSSHTLGHTARDLLEHARKQIAKSINASPAEILFTSGGTESNNLAIKGVAFANRNKGNHIITTTVEHTSIINSCKWLETQGFTVTYLPVDSEGFITPEQLEKAITDKTILFSAMHGNNEIGTILDLKGLGAICKKHSIYFHIDACQSYTKAELDAKEQHLDLITLNAHKLHGPKGVGALYIKNKTSIVPWQHGGGQEFDIRGGTENIPGIVGFAKAQAIADSKEHNNRMTKLRDRLIDGILQIPHSRLNGPLGNRRLCNNINVSFKDVDGVSLGGYLDEHGIYASGGSACSEKKLKPSHVLKAINVPEEYINGSIRLTISRFTTEEDIDYVLKTLPKVVDKLRKR